MGVPVFINISRISEEGVISETLYIEILDTKKFHQYFVVIDTKRFAGYGEGFYFHQENVEEIVNIGFMGM